VFAAWMWGLMGEGMFGESDSWVYGVHGS
jgi:hypothetical protein